MKIVLIARRGATPRTFHLAPKVKWSLLFMLGFFLPLCLMSLGYWLATQRSPQLPNMVIVDPSETQQSDIHSHNRVLIDELGRLEARIMSIEAISNRLLKMTGASDIELIPPTSEFLSNPSAQDEDMAAVVVRTRVAQLRDKTNQLDQRIDVLTNLLLEQKWQGERLISGWPIQKGWISSRYGYRNDPFHGRREFHKGIDFAGKDNSPVVAVAGGLVTWAGKRFAYGNLVEINHGNGFVTRYGHNKSLIVGVGELVEKGQIIAKMGSSGRSTGPHVHFEVFQNGKHTNPMRYVRGHRG